MGIISNLGSNFLFLNINTILIIIILPLDPLVKRFPKIYKYYLSLKNKLVFNSIIRLLLEGYLEFSICSLLNILALSDSSLKQNTNNYQQFFSVTSLAVVILFPIISICLMFI